MDIIEVIILDREFKITDSLLWCAESSIIISSYKVLHSENTFGRGIIYGFKISFITEEDAVAFKLRWI